MPDRAKIIKNATIRARNDWIDYTVVQERQMFNLFNDAANSLVKQIERFSVEGMIPPARMTQLYANIKDEMAGLRLRLAGNVKTGMRNSIDYGIKTGMKSMEAANLPARFKIGVGSSFIGKDGKIRKYDPKEEAYKDSSWAKINKNAMDAVLRWQPAGMTLSQRVWDITYQSEKLLRSKIQQAVLTGQSAAGLSREIRGFLAEPRKLFRSRRVDGKLVLSKAAEEYHPGIGVYRSSYKNAIRLARTELAEAYTEGTFRYAKQKDWIKGYIWRVASGEPCPICQDYHGSFFPKDEYPPLPAHPFCYCYAEMVIDEEKVWHERRL